MTQQERIEQAAREYLDSRISDWDIKDFELVKGAYRYLLSHQWISVDEELPKDNKVVFYIALSEKGTKCYGSGFVSNKEWYTDIDCAAQDYYHYKITHWMEIPSLKGGEG